VSDVFLSYAAEDRDRAARLAIALGVLGWSVWWDRKIIAGEAFDRAIERELESAKCVVVLWSKQSIASEWVKNEAAAASERNVLVPAAIDGVKLPLEFRRRQTADLVDWKGEPAHAGFQALCEGIANTIGGSLPPQAAPPEGKAVLRRPRWTRAAMALVVVAVAIGLYLRGPWRAPEPPGASAGLADLVAGSYLGNVMADSKGSSRSDIDVTVTKLDRSTVRVTSDYRRVGTVELKLTRVGNKILAADGDSPFIVDLERNPPTLNFNPRNELAYAGTRRK
jgi:hypothetical protein